MWTIDTPWFDVALFLSLYITGTVFFGHFEQHRPAWRRFLKPVMLLIMLLQQLLWWHVAATVPNVLC